MEEAKRTKINSDALREIAEILTKEYGDSPALSKLLEPKTQFTQPQGARHTGEIIRKELETGHRLVGNPWKQDVKESDTVGLHVVDYGNQWMISHPENADVVELVVNSTQPTTHQIGRASCRERV